MRAQDGEVITMLGRDFEVIVDEPDEDGHGYVGARCVTCEASMRLSDDAMQDHECPPACPECGQRDEDARTEPASDGYLIWRCCGQEARCPCGSVASTNHRFVCKKWITP